MKLQSILLAFKNCWVKNVVLLDWGIRYFNDRLYRIGIDEFSTTAIRVVND